VALADEVEARYALADLVAASNPDDLTQTGVDSTRMAAAVADATAEFRHLTGLELDDTDAEHVAAACPGVVWFLARYNQRQDEAVGALRKQFDESCERLSKARGIHRRATWQGTGLACPRGWRARRA
jgi:hypothetical protein